MARYDPHKNRGYDGYAVVGYSATSESYAASSTEEVVTMGGYPVRPDLHSQIWPRGSTHFQPKMSEEYGHSPKYGSPHDSPRKALQRAGSPPKGGYPGKYGAHLANPNDFSPRSPKFNHTNGDSPRKSTFHGVNSPPAGHYSPPGGHYSGKYGPHPNSPRDSPRKDFRENRGGFSSDDDDSSDEDVECRDGVCYPKTEYGAGAGGRQGYDYDKEKKKGTGYAPGNYPVIRTTGQRPTDNPYRPKSDGRKYYGGEKQPEGDIIHGSHPYNAPAHTKPNTGAYYSSENEPYAVPAPIKTRPDRRDGGDNGRSSPVSAVAQWTPFAESPRIGKQGRAETIDSSEAQRRYGNAPPQYGAAAADRRFAIDSKTAAAMYGGVFL